MVESMGYENKFILEVDQSITGAVEHQSVKRWWEKRSPTISAWSSKSGSLELLSGDRQKQFLKLRKMENLSFSSVMWMRRCPSTLMKGIHFIK